MGLITCPVIKTGPSSLNMREASYILLFWMKVINNGHTFCIKSKISKLRSGFSLLEVMIVVVIIGILATLAYPNLEAYLQRSKQTEAKVSLSAIRTAQKIYFATNQTYADTLSKLDVQL